MIRICYALGALFLSAGIEAAEPQGQTAILSLPDGRGELSIRMSERSNDEDRTLQLDRAYQPIDPRTQLIVSFSAPESTLRTPLLDRWAQLNNLLDEANLLLEERRAIVALAASTQKDIPHQVVSLQQASKKYGTKFNAFRKRVRNLLGEFVYSKIDEDATERADNADASERQGFLEVLAEWIQSERAALHKETSSITENVRTTATIHVEAYLEPRKGEVRRVHVVGYDNIAAGRSGELNQTGLAMTPAQAAELKHGYELAQRAAGVIREIQGNQNGIREELQKFRNTLSSSLEVALAQERQFLEAQVQQLRNVKATLAAFETTSGDASAAAKRLQITVGKLENAVGLVASAYETAAQIQGAAKESLPSFLVALTSSESPVNAFAKGARETEAELHKLPDLIRDAKADLPVVIGAISAGGNDEVVRSLKMLQDNSLATLLDSKDRMLQQIPSIKQLMEGAKQLVVNENSDENAAKKLTGGEVVSIPRNLNELEDAKIRLRDLGAGKGDVLRVVVRVEGNGLDGQASSKAKEFEFEMKYLGLYLDYSGQLVFVAPAQKPDRHNFQAAAAVLATYRGGCAKPGSWYSKSWCWLDFGLGPHVTALNQGSATAETGIGASISVKDNLLTAGYGWNLGVTGNPPYYFVGIGLLELLQQFRTVKVPDSNGK